MSLKIDTFSNKTGGNAFYKALAHPVTGDLARPFLARLRAEGPVAVYDPLGGAQAFDALHPLSGVALDALYVQDIEEIGAERLGLTAQPITALPESKAKLLLVTAFDADRLVDHIRHLIPKGMAVVTLDALRLPEILLTDRRRYLNPLNFATNFAFFRDADGLHTRLRTANYWGSYGATDVSVWCRLFDAEGQPLAEWTESLGGPNATVELDSREIRARFGLGAFTGQLFVHVLGAAGHDVVKYALDTYGDAPDVLSCTHDANAWPAEFYAGLPAPAKGEKVILWLQNSHPHPIAAGEISLNRMGRTDCVAYDRPIAGFGSVALDVSTLLPGLAWPEQIEIRAGKHMVRPRYEITKANGRMRISHPNVERVDLKPQPRLADLGNLMGKGYVLPAPILPPTQFRSLMLPTPMSTAQTSLPVAMICYDTEGREILRRFLGDLPRDHALAVDLGEEVAGRLNGHGGHAELVYDFRAGGLGDGWLHALFRYEDTQTGHAAETSFGAHIFNTVLTYQDEPQSYAGRAPGLSTRLFLRLAEDPYDAFCQLIYPASTPWKDRSDTTLMLHDGEGREIARTTVQIACGGSLLWRYSEMFDASAREQAGPRGYVIIRDTTCRLFGYHGLMNPGHAFSLDHMFGF